MALTETYLELAPEFGGTRFGPFKGMEIRLGSDPSNNDIVLPENLGVLPQHVKLIAQGDGSFIVAPIERTAGVFVYRSGSNAKQVTSPIAIQGASDTYSADSFAVVTSEGPRFYVLLVTAKQEGKSKQSDFDKAKKRLSGKSLVSEIKRMGITSFLTTRGGQQIQRWGTFIKTGAILRPRNLIGGAMMLLGWVGAAGIGVVACNAAVGQRKADENYQDCQVRYEECSGSEDGGLPKLENYASKILSNKTWKAALKADADLFVAFKEELNAILLSDSRRRKLKWVYKKKNSDFVKVKKAMKTAGWPDELVRTMAYVAALEGNGAERRWSLIDGDSAGESVCGRGPMAMTWRQAEHLKIPDISIDAAMPYQKFGAAGSEDKETALIDTTGTMPSYETPDADEIGDVNNEQPGNSQEYMCLFNGPDEDPIDPRSTDKLKELMAALSKKIGPSAKGMPDIENTFGVASRLMLYWASDYGGNLKDVDFSSGGVPTIMMNDAKRAKPYAVRKTAETLAKAVAIPCLARLDPEFDDLDLPKTIGEDAVPGPLDCIIIESMLKYNLQ